MTKCALDSDTIKLHWLTLYRYLNPLKVNHLDLLYIVY